MTRKFNGLSSYLYTVLLPPMKRFKRKYFSFYGWEIRYRIFARDWIYGRKKEKKKDFIKRRALKLEELNKKFKNFKFLF